MTGLTCRVKHCGKGRALRSLDSFVQLTNDIVWGWGDEQPRPQRESSPFTYTETQRSFYSPHPQVSDTWDLMDHGLDHWVTEEPAAPGRRQLPPPSPHHTSSTRAQIEDSKTSDSVEHSAREGSPNTPTAPSKADPAESPPSITKPRIALSIAPGRARPTHPQLHQRQTQPRAHHRYHRPATLKQSLPCHHYPATLVPHSHRLKSRPRRRQTLPAVKKSTSSHSSPQRSRALGKKGCRKQVPICVGQSAWRVQATGQKAAAGAARLGSR